MRKSAGLVTFLLSSVTLGSVALAADPLPAAVIITPAVQPPPVVPTLAGYVDAHFALNKGHEEGFFEGDPIGEFSWRSNAIGGAGRAAWNISPSFALQLDAWFNFWHYREFDEGEEVFEETFGDGGVGTHFVFETAGGLKAGALVSVGRSYGTWINVAGEVAQSFGNFRISAQGGLTLGVAGEPREDGERSYYFGANATFYPNPNLALTGFAQWSKWYETADEFDGGDNDWEQGWDLGARAEFKLGSSPLSIYAGYIYSRWHGGTVEVPDLSWEGRAHTIFVGVRMLLGRDTLQDLDNAVPFADYNLMYGDFTAHR